MNIKKMLFVVLATSAFLCANEGVRSGRFAPPESSSLQQVQQATKAKIDQACAKAEEFKNDVQNTHVPKFLRQIQFRELAGDICVYTGYFIVISCILASPSYLIGGIALLIAKKQVYDRYFCQNGKRASD